jgi:hypothetical protein
MALETGSFISDLNASNPTSTDLKSQGDDHIRLVKAAVKGTFPNVTGAVTASHTVLNTVSLKANAADAALTGIPTAPTASFGVATTQVATAAFVQTALQALHPVGSIYTSTSSTNPSTSFGFGTWVQFGAGRVLLGVGGSFSAGATGGSNDAVVVSHTHSASSTVTDPGHAHSVSGIGGWYSGGEAGSYVGGGSSRSNNTNASATGISVATTVNSTGVSGTNANLPPFIVVYLWNRTA